LISQREQESAMKVRKVEARETAKGNGIFALYNLQKDQVVMSFGGVLVSVEEMLAAQDRGENLWWNAYARQVSETHGVVPRDPADFGGHLVNHSCDPNAAFDGGVVVASRNIKKGEEVTCCYGWLRQKEDQDCLCDAAFCAGIMGVGIVVEDAGHTANVQIRVRATTVGAIMAAAILNERHDLYVEYTKSILFLYSEAGATTGWIDACAAWAFDAIKTSVHAQRNVMRELCAEGEGRGARRAPPDDLTYVTSRPR